MVFDLETKVPFAAVVPTDCLLKTDEWSNEVVSSIARGEYAFTFLVPVGFIKVKAFFTAATENGEIFRYERSEVERSEIESE